MANAIAANFAIDGTTTSFSCLWKLSRCQKSAGWYVFASSNGSAKDVTANKANDKWGTNSNPLSDTQPTLNSGSWYVISGPQTIRIMLNAAPTGTPIRGEVVTQQNTGATGELYGYVYDTSGTTGGWAVVIPQSAPASTTIDSASNGASISSTTSYTVASTSGFALSGFFQVMSTTGIQVVYYTGTTSTTFTGCTSNGSGTVATGNGVFGYSVIFDGNDVLSGNSSAATLTPLKTTSTGSQTLPLATINVASNGTNGFPSVGIIQVSSSNGTQYIKYTGVTSSSFTGCTGGTGTISASTPVYAAATYFSREFMFGSNDATNNGSIYYICGDYAVEGAMMFSTLATSSDCTATVWPGGGSSTTWKLYTASAGPTWPASSYTVGSTSGFPSSGVLIGRATASGDTQTTYQVPITYTSITNSTVFGGVSVPAAFNGYTQIGDTHIAGVLQTSTTNGFHTTSPVGTPFGLAIAVRGTGGDSTGQSNTQIFGSVAWKASSGHAQIACVNAIGASGVTPDGSFYAALTTSGAVVANSMAGFMYTRMDRGEPGDLDPYIWIGSSDSIVPVLPLTQNNIPWKNTGGGTGAANFLLGSNVSGSIGIFRGTFNAPNTQVAGQGYRARGCTFTKRDHSTGYQAVCLPSGATGPDCFVATATVRLSCHPATTAPFVQDGLWFINTSHSKGLARWIKLSNATTILDTYDSKTMFCGQIGTSSSIPSLIIGPYDGSTTPST